jgi:hypothetical protein
MGGWKLGMIGAGLTLSLLACDDEAADGGGQTELDMSYQLRDASVLVVDQGQIEPDPPLGGQGGDGGGEAGGGGAAGGAGGTGGAATGGTGGGDVPCEEAVERCNGVDDNCNGEVDETWRELGSGCSVPQGACTARGTVICNSTGDGVICGADDVEAADEICNGVDDDCDDLVDEDFPGQTCCTENIHCPVGNTCEDGMCTGGGVNPNPNPGGGAAGCEAPMVMPGFGQYPGDTTNVQNGDAGLCGFLYLAGEAVYSFTLPETQRVQVSAEGFLIETSIYVRTTCDDIFSETACNSDGEAPVATFEAQAGVEYFVFVDSPLFGGAFTLTFAPAQGGPQPECQGDLDCGFDEVCQGGQCVPDAQPECLDDADCIGDQICQAQQCVPGPVGPACVADADCAAGETCDAGQCMRPLVGGACQAAVAMAAPGRYEGTTVDHANEHVNTCQARALGGEAIFTFEVAEASRVTLNTDDSDFDTVLSVRTDCADMASELACNDDGAGLQSLVTFDADPGITYYAIVDGYDGRSGAVVLDYSLDIRPAGCPCGDGLVCVQEACYPAPPAACATAYLEGDGVGDYGGNSALGENNHAPSCQQFSNAPESILAFTVDAPRAVSVNTEGSEFDTVVYVMSDCGTEIACDDDSGGGLSSALSFDAVPDTLYYIVVDGFEEQSGIFQLTVR